MTCYDSIAEDDIVYGQTSCVDSYQLIREVKKYPVLYNHQVDGFNDYAAKELIWDKIHEALYPKYRSFAVQTQNVIKQTVRRRWRTMRTALARDVKERCTKENYQRSENPLLVEMQFLIPFIRSIYAKIAQHQQHESRHNFSDDNTMFHDIANIAERDETEFNNLSMSDNKPTIEIKSHVIIDANTFSTRSLREEPVPAANNSSQVDSFHNGYCVTECNAGEFTSSIAYTAQEVVANPDPVQTQQATTPLPVDNTHKRSRTDSDFQDKLLELLSMTAFRKDQPSEREAENEDRMFLLSLVSDLKSLPPTKKMLVKAEIVTSIARGAQ